MARLGQSTAAGGGTASRRSCAAVLLAALALLGGCAADPGAGSGKGTGAGTASPSSTGPFRHWLEQWRSERGAWVSAVRGLTGDISGNSINVERFNADSARVRDAAQALADALDAAGPAPSPPATTRFDRALHAGVGDVVSASTAGVSCREAACVPVVTRVLQAVTQVNALLTLASPERPTPATTVSADDALLSRAEVGVAEQPTALDPLKDLCATVGESAATSAAISFVLDSPARLLVQRTLRFPSAQMASSFFQGVGVLTVICAGQSRSLGGSVQTWERGSAPDVGVPVVLSRIDDRGSETIHSLVVAALTGETVTTMALYSHAELGDDALSVYLARALQRLGVDVPTPSVTGT